MRISNHFWTGTKFEFRGPIYVKTFRFFKELEDLELFVIKARSSEYPYGWGTQDANPMRILFKEYFAQKHEADGSYNIPTVRITEQQ